MRASPLMPASGILDRPVEPGDDTADVGSTSRPTRKSCSRAQHQKAPETSPGLLSFHASQCDAVTSASASAS
ncbi:hypothetical protein CV770_13820 [Bradyrhizobium sp. AC87j1]|nr:hypothetical protein CV770_13820 [Bradyrhizobium sp. AC87j1]